MYTGEPAPDIPLDDRCRTRPSQCTPIGIIEFDDQGALQSRSYKDQIMAQIRAEAEKNSTLIVVFAHGWLNNAAPENGNLEEFQKLM